MWALPAQVRILPLTFHFVFFSLVSHSTSSKLVDLFYLFSPLNIGSCHVVELSACFLQFDIFKVQGLNT